MMFGKKEKYVQPSDDEIKRIVGDALTRREEVVEAREIAVVEARNQMRLLRNIVVSALLDAECSNMAELVRQHIDELITK